MTQHNDSRHTSVVSRTLDYLEMLNEAGEEINAANLLKLIKSSPLAEEQPTNNHRRNCMTEPTTTPHNIIAYLANLDRCSKMSNVVYDCAMEYWEMLEASGEEFSEAKLDEMVAARKNSAPACQPQETRNTMSPEPKKQVYSFATDNGRTFCALQTTASRLACNTDPITAHPVFVHDNVEYIALGTIPLIEPSAQDLEVDAIQQHNSRRQSVIDTMKAAGFTDDDIAILQSPLSMPAKWHTVPADWDKLYPPFPIDGPFCEIVFRNGKTQLSATHAIKDSLSFFQGGAPWDVQKYRPMSKYPIK